LSTGKSIAENFLKAPSYFFASPKRFNLSPNSYIGFALVSFVLAFICHEDGRKFLFKLFIYFPAIDHSAVIYSVIGLCGISISLIFFANRKNLFLKKELQLEKEPESSGGIRCEMYGTDENAKLVIKSLGTAERGFKNFGDIVNDTNLPLNAINHTLDWLVINKLSTEAEGRKGKVYELSPKGRNSFSHIIIPKN
jgi:predicted transcriptional regulator